MFYSVAGIHDSYNIVWVAQKTFGRITIQGLQIIITYNLYIAYKYFKLLKFNCFNIFNCFKSFDRDVES